MKKLIFVAIFSFTQSIFLFGQNAPPQLDSIDISFTSQIVANPAPTFSSKRDVPVAETFLTTREFGFSAMVLTFGLLVIVLQVYLVKLKIFSDGNAVKFILVTVIVTAAMFLITAAYDSKQVAPIMGLLGTMVGYLLGNGLISNKQNQE